MVTMCGYRVILVVLTNTTYGTNAHYSAKNIGLQGKEDLAKNTCIIEKKCWKHIRYPKTGLRFMILERKLSIHSYSARVSIISLEVKM